MLTCSTTWNRPFEIQLSVCYEGLWIPTGAITSRTANSYDAVHNQFPDCVVLMQRRRGLMSQLARRCSVSYSSGSPCYSRTGGNIFPPHKQMNWSVFTTQATSTKGLIYEILNIIQGYSQAELIKGYSTDFYLRWINEFKEKIFQRMEKSSAASWQESCLLREWRMRWDMRFNEIR